MTHVGNKGLYRELKKKGFGIIIYLLYVFLFVLIVKKNKSSGLFWILEENH